MANANAGTSNVRDIVISPNGGGIKVDGFGACVPVNCEWGNVRGTLFGSNAGTPTGSSLEAQWNFGFSRTVVAKLTHLGFVPVLVVQELTTFTDGSGRSDFAVTESFVRRGLPIFPARHGIPGFNFPPGDSVHPASSLLGVWLNTSPSGGNIRKIIVSLNPNGTLAVRAFGNCVPTVCGWGKVTGVTFGTSVSSLAGRTFLAPDQTFGFANKLVDGTVNVQGTVLTVTTYTEFTGHSGRSNYVSTTPSSVLWAYWVLWDLRVFWRFRGGLRGVAIQVLDLDGDFVLALCWLCGGGG